MEKRVQVHVPYPLLIERFEEVLREGINPEIYLDCDSLDSASQGDLERIRDGFGEKGLVITVHGPYAELNPGSANEATRLKTVESYRKVFRAASILRPRSIVLHAGYSDRKFHGDPGPWLSQSLKTWPEFIAEAERIGTVIAAENIFEKAPGTLKSLAEAISSPRFGVCIDSGHLSVFSGVEMEEWFRELGPHIAEVHLHDNHGEADEHLPLGEGRIDFRRFLSLLEAHAKDPVYTIEPHGEEVLKRALKAVRRFL